METATIPCTTEAPAEQMLLVRYTCPNCGAWAEAPDDSVVAHDCPKRLNNRGHKLFTRFVAESPIAYGLSAAEMDELAEMESHDFPRYEPCM